MAPGDTPSRKRRRQTVATPGMRAKRFKENGGDAAGEMPRRLCDFYDEREDLSKSFDVLLQATGSVESGRFPILHGVFGLAKTMFDGCVDWASKQIGAARESGKVENAKAGVILDHSSVSANVSSHPTELLPRISVQRLASTAAENSSTRVSKDYVACNSQKSSTNAVVRVKKEPRMNLVRAPLSSNVSSLTTELLPRISVQRLSNTAAENSVSCVSKGYAAKKCNSQESSANNVTKVTKEPSTMNFDGSPLSTKVSAFSTDFLPHVSMRRLSSIAVKISASSESKGHEPKKRNTQVLSTSYVTKVKKEPFSPSRNSSCLTGELSPQVSMQRLPSTAAKNSAAIVSKGHVAKKRNTQVVTKVKKEPQVPSTSYVKKVKKEPLIVKFDCFSPSKKGSSLTRELSPQSSMQRLPSTSAKNSASDRSKGHVAKKCNSQELSFKDSTKVTKNPGPSFSLTSISCTKELSPQISAQRLSSTPAKYCVKILQKNPASNVSNSNVTEKCKTKFSAKNVPKAKCPDRKACKATEPVVKKLRLHGKSKSVVNCGQRVNVNLSQSSLSAQSNFGWRCGKNGDPPYVYAGLSPQIYVIPVDDKCNRWSRICRAQI